MRSIFNKVFFPELHLRQSNTLKNFYTYNLIHMLLYNVIKHMN